MTSAAAFSLLERALSKKKRDKQALDEEAEEEL
jgi:hypothetical protein